MFQEINCKPVDCAAVPCTPGTTTTTLPPTPCPTPTPLSAVSKPEKKFTSLEPEKNFYLPFLKNVCLKPET
jgi:hypothetical protein